MTYKFPPSLYQLRDYLKGLGADTGAFVSARQAAFMAQQLLGSRVKFPDKGADMTSTLFLIQKAVTEKGIAMMATPSRYSHDTNTSSKKAKKKGSRQLPKAKSNKHNKDFSPEVFSEGIHIFCDGASVPNPGVGGWGVVVYQDGKEIASGFGGDPETTNNQMELTGLLKAIETAKGYYVLNYPPVTIWCDSQYCVKGVNDWRHGWKKNGWQRGSDKAEPHNRPLANADLWQAIDEALSITAVGGISVKWVKGHHGVAGNERADELAEIGRDEAEKISSNLRSSHDQDLDAQYRQIMGVM